MFEVFRFAWFAARTFFGIVALVLSLHAALWLFVKVLSAAPGDDDPRAALRHVNAYNAARSSRERGTTKPPTLSTESLTARPTDENIDGRSIPIRATWFRANIECDKDGSLRVATTEIEADCQSSDRTAGLAPGRRSDRGGGALDQ